MMPGTRRVRRGQDADREVGLRLIGRVWQTFARPYRSRLLLLIALIGLMAVMGLGYV